MAQARGNAAAADPHRPGAGAIRLAPDAPSGRQRAGICRLRWGVRLYRIALAAGR